MIQCNEFQIIHKATPVIKIIFHNFNCIFSFSPHPVELSTSFLNELLLKIDGSEFRMNLFNLWMDQLFFPTFLSHCRHLAVPQ